MRDARGFARSRHHVLRHVRGKPAKTCLSGVRSSGGVVSVISSISHAGIATHRRAVLVFPFRMRKRRPVHFDVAPLKSVDLTAVERDAVEPVDAAVKHARPILERNRVRRRATSDTQSPRVETNPYATVYVTAVD
jgi:hypothetical protein